MKPVPRGQALSPGGDHAGNPAFHRCAAQRPGRGIAVAGIQGSARAPLPRPTRGPRASAAREGAPGTGPRGARRRRRPVAKVRLRKRGEAGGAKEEVRGDAGAGGLRRRADAMGRLHCTQDPVPEAVGGDMQQLNQLGAQKFSALTEVLFRFLTEPKEVERFLAQLSEFATTNQISLGPLRSIVKSLLLVPNGALKKSLTAEQVRADFITLGLSEEKATYFSEKWKQNAPTLARWAIGQTLMINQLIDMEWTFGVTSGSSELEKVGSIFLQLKLVVKKGNQTENLYIELTLPQFYSFLHEMERVRTSMECFS